MYMNFKRFLSVILALVLMLSCLSISFGAFAEEPRYFQRGVLTDGERTAYWIIDKDNKILYLSGDGVNYANTPDYPDADHGPFSGRTDVTRIVIEEDVNYVGAYVFANITSVDTIEIQSNLLKRENSIDSNAFSGDTNIRNVQGDSEVLSTNTLINAVKVGIGIFTGDWLGVVSNVIHTGSDVLSDDGTLQDNEVDAMVNDYITNGGTIFIGDFDELVAAYDAKLECPCYHIDTNSFTHNYSEQIISNPTCTEEGTKTLSCSVCGDVHDEAIPALGHNYIDSVYVEPTCTMRGVMDHTCSVCGDCSFSVIQPLGHTLRSIPRIRATCTSTGLTEGSYCTVCGATIQPQEVIPMTPHVFFYTYDAATDSYSAFCDYCENTYTEFDNDTEALIAAESWYNSLNAGDYTPESYGALYDVAALHSGLTAEDTLQYPQFAIDEEITEILTRITELQPYLNVNLEAENGTVTYTDGDTVYGEGENSIVFGTDVTFTAVPDEGYKFIAWYDVNTKRYLSTSSEFTYKITSNLNLQAVITDASYSTLTFRGEGGQVIASYSYPHDDWAERDDIDDLIPRVPYKYGYTNGRWSYTPRVVVELSLGNDQNISAEYDAVEVDVPELPALVSETAPSLTLSYSYSYENHFSVGTLIMASNIPEGCDVQTIGIAYIKAPAEIFTPSDVNLTLNNSVTTARFEGISDSGLYILNIRNLGSRSNWAVKGYMTYYENGVLKIAYTNQINIVNRYSV